MARVGTGARVADHGGPRGGPIAADHKRAPSAPADIERYVAERACADL